MPGLDLPRTPYDLFVYDFSYDFSGIVGGYGLGSMFTLETSTVRFLVRAFGNGPRQSRTETVRRS